MPGGTHEIKTRFKLEGEQEYRRAMKESADAIKVLASEQKLAKAEFEQTGDAQQYAADSARILREEIEHQKSSVNAAESALKELAANGVAENSKQVQTWKKKLNEAKTTLVQMETRLDGVERELNESGTAYKGNETKIKSLETAMKNLDAKEKLAEAQYRETGDAQQYAADKAQILRDKIDLQKQIVAQCEQAIKSMTENGVDPNSAEMVEWKTKLANAKTTLTQLETQLDKTEKELEDQSGDLGTAKKAVTDAETAIKNLNAREKLAEAQFKATGNSEQLLADKTQILKEKIDAQKTVVKNCEKAIKALTDKGVEPNAKEMVEWKTKLANAKTALSGLETRLDNVGEEVKQETTEFKNAEGGADDLKASLDKVAEGVDFSNTIAGIQRITGTIEAVARKAMQAAKAIFDLQMEAGDWADTILTESTKMQIDPETYQSWVYASRTIDTSVSDISTGMQKIESSLEGATTDTLAGFAKLGVATRDMTGKQLSYQQVFWNAIDSLHAMTDEQKRADAATQLFGKSWKNLQPLIEAGSKEYFRVAEEGKKVAVVSNDNVTALGQMDDAYEELSSRLEKAKFDALAALAPTFKEIAEGLSEAVSSLDEFIQSEAGQQALTELGEALKGIIGAFTGEEGGDTFKGIVDAAKQAVVGFTDAMKWISENGETVKNLIGLMAIAWAGLKATSSILTFMQLLKDTPLSKLTTLFGGGGAASGAAGSAGSAGTAVGANAAKKGAALGLKGAGISAAKDLLLGAGTSAAVVAAAVTPAVLANNADKKRITERLEGVRKKAAEDAVNMGLDDAAQALEIVNDAVEALGVQEDKKDVFGQTALGDEAKVDAALKKAAQANAPFMKPRSQLLLDRYVSGNGGSAQQAYQLLNQVMEDAAAYLEQGAGGEGANLSEYADPMESISDSLDRILETKEALEETPGDTESALKLVDDLTDAGEVVDALSDKTKELIAAYYDEESGFGAGSATQFTDALQVLEAIEEDLQGAWDRWVAGGKNVAEGMAEGIADGSEDAQNAASDMAGSTADAAEKTLGIKSPSRVFRLIGENVAVGMANGIYARASEAIRAAQWLADQIRRTVQQALQIHSPSRVFEQLGEYTGMGFAEGLQRSAAAVSRAAGNMVRATVQAPVRAVPLSPAVYASPVAATRQGASAGVGNVHVTLMLDEEVLGDVMAPLVNEKIGAKINATRR